jgi:RNA recognition motif-containing protein
MSTANIYTRNNVMKRRINENVNRYKTLLVSGLRYDINEKDLYHHFIKCAKVTLKRCQASSQKYSVLY